MIYVNVADLDEKYNSYFWRCRHGKKNKDSR